MNCSTLEDNPLEDRSTGAIHLNLTFICSHPLSQQKSPQNAGFSVLEVAGVEPWPTGVPTRCHFGGLVA
jgi:hypothetical protein